MPYFWNDPSNLAPKQAHRWVIHFGEDKVFYYAKSVDRPSYNLNTVKGKLLYSHTVNFPGRLTWNPIKVTLYDVNSTNFTVLSLNAGGETTRGTPRFSTQYLIHQNVMNSEYSDPSQNNLKAIFKESLNKHLGIVKLIEMDRYGGPSTLDGKPALFDSNIEKDSWMLYNPIISDVNYGTLDYANTEVLAITLTIAYDWAEMFPFIPNAGEESKKFDLAKAERSMGIAASGPNNNSVVRRPSAVSQA